MGDFERFIKRCEEVREMIGRMHSPLIVNHYDADGLASGGLVAKALRMAGKEFRIMTTRKLDEGVIESLKGEKEIIFVDFGGGAKQLELVEERLGKSDVVVIDHHQTKESKILQANPHLFGFDGGSELSAAGTAYFVFRQPELVELAIVGAMGDMQHPLKGLNRKILEEGKKHGMVEVGLDLTLFGRVSRGLVWFLQYCSEPYLPGLTGKRAACAQFLEELGIELKEGERWRKYYELPHDEKVKIVSGLVALLYSREADDATIKSLVGEVYTFPRQEQGTELSDANEFSTALNACGRHNRPEVGVGVCLGEKKAIEEAQELLLLHRRQLREGMEFASQAVEDFGVYYFLDGRGIIDDGLIGVVAGMMYGGTIQRTKPIIAAALNEEGQIKISGRATKKLCAQGLNLGKMLSKATEGIGAGGGHNIAAGAQVETGKMNEFLLGAGEIVTSQLNFP